MRLFNSRRYQFLAVVVIFHSGGLRASAEGAATAEDVNRLADSATQIVTAFMQESFHLRMGYEYYDRFETDGDRETLLKLASKAADDLHRTAGRQRELKKRIEDYEGDDWEERFGSTGLWRKVAAELYRTELAICEVRYYHALACEQRGRNELLEQIISHIDSLEQSHRSSAAGTGRCGLPRFGAGEIRQICSVQRCRAAGHGTNRENQADRRSDKRADGIAAWSAGAEPKGR